MMVKMQETQLAMVEQLILLVLDLLLLLTGPLTGGELQFVQFHYTQAATGLTIKIYDAGTATAPGTLLLNQLLDIGTINRLVVGIQLNLILTFPYLEMTYGLFRSC